MNNKITTTIALVILDSGLIGIMTGTAFADPNNPKADENVHENTPGGFGGDQDVRYHEGTCQGGSDHPACDLDIVTDPGNSDDHRQDD